MTRPRKPRTCACPHRADYSAVYKPTGTPLNDMDVIHLAQDELEALHLCDGEGMTQEEAGVCMEVSRGTVQRLLAGGRKKVAVTLVYKKALAIGIIGDTTNAAPILKQTIEEVSSDSMHCTATLQSQS